MHASGRRARRAPAPPFRRRAVRCARISSRSSRAAVEGRPVHQPHHLRRDADARAAGSGWRRSVSITCSFRSRTSIPSTPTRSPATRAGRRRSARSPRWVKELGLPLTLNVVVHRHNIESLPAMIDYAVEIGAGPARGRAHAVLCVGAEESRGTDPDARAVPGNRRNRQRGARAPQGHSRLRRRRRTITTPCVPSPAWADGESSLIDDNAVGQGAALSCRRTITWLEHRQRAHKPTGATSGSTVQAFKAIAARAWMKEPCRSCDRREIDWGGCRCQALAMTGDAANADPACAMSPWHNEFAALAEQESRAPAPPFVYRRIAPPFRS